MCENRLQQHQLFLLLDNQIELHQKHQLQ